MLNYRAWMERNQISKLETRDDEWSPDGLLIVARSEIMDATFMVPVSKAFLRDAADPWRYVLDMIEDKIKHQLFPTTS